MDTGYLSLTVYFEAPFWVGVVQRHCQESSPPQKPPLGLNQATRRFGSGCWSAGTRCAFRPQ